MKFLIKASGKFEKLMHEGKKNKFPNPKVKHHYVHAVKHYKSYKQEMKNKNMDTANKHAELINQHIKHGNLTGFHRDQMQHDSRYSKPAGHTDFKPYKKRKGRSTFVKSFKFFIRG